DAERLAPADVGDLAFASAQRLDVASRDAHVDIAGSLPSRCVESEQRKVPLGGVRSRSNDPWPRRRAGLKLKARPSLEVEHIERRPKAHRGTGASDQGDELAPVEGPIPAHTAAIMADSITAAAGHRLRSWRSRRCGHYARARGTRRPRHTAGRAGS